MGKIKDLRKKVADNTASDDEKAELAELEAEAQIAEPVTVTPEPNSNGTDDEDEAVERMADALVSKLTSKLDKVTQAIEKASTPAPVASVTREAGFVVDKSLGKVTVDKLEDVKIQLPGRKAAGKSVTEVDGRTLHFLHALRYNDVQKLQILSEGTAADGGYLVPDQFANMIVEDLRDEAVMRQLAETVTITSDTFHLPRLDSRPQVQWRAEKAVKATSTAQFSELVFTPYSLAGIVPLSQELSDDATLGTNGSIINYIGRLLTRAIAEKEDRAFWTGSGSGQPTGISTYTLSTTTTNGTDAGIASAIVTGSMLMPQGFRNRAAWVANANTWARIGGLKDSNNNFLLSNLAGSATPVLRGRPIYEQNDLANGELYFGDFSYYMIVDRAGVSVRASDEATVAGSSAFERNLVFVRAEKRVDGELTLNSAVRKITGL